MLYKFPRTFGDYVNLRPWKRAAHLLEPDSTWTWAPLYDLKQLSENKIKVSTAT